MDRQDKNNLAPLEDGGNIITRAKENKMWEICISLPLFYLTIFKGLIALFDLEYFIAKFVSETLPTFKWFGLV
jgi:hypothetical protein